jgi:hypothetical protein
MTFLLFVAFRREILLASFDPEFDRTLGRDPSRADALFFGLLGGAIALGVMDAGPLVVFGFLVLPPLAALRVAPGLVTAMWISASIASVCSVGGFALAYRVDLPTGPTSVALAALTWLLLSLAARLRGRLSRASRAGTAVALLVPLLLAGAMGCRTAPDPQPNASRVVDRGTLPDLADLGPISVARFRNRTNTPLRIASGNPWTEARQAVGRGTDPPWTVLDSLQSQAILELAQRGLAVRSFDEVRASLPDVPGGADDAARRARDADLAGPVLYGVLSRYTFSQAGLLLVRLDLVLVDPATGDVLWSGQARRPVAVKSALTDQEIVLDAAPEIFAEAFGSR